MSNSTPSQTATVGVDAGASLCKLVLPNGGEMRTALFPAQDLDAVRSCIESWKPQRISATGGGAARLGEIAGVSVQTVPEFEAWARGAPILADAAQLQLPERYLLVSLGTGTSVLGLTPAGAQRVGGSALGGGTLLGLGRLLLGVESFAEMTELARRGDRRKVDLLVGDIYRGLETPLPGELNAASFGKLDSREPEDLAAALMGLIGENIALICGTIANSQGFSEIFYCGSTLWENPVLRQIIAEVSAMYAVPAEFLPNGRFCGAVGAAATGGAFAPEAG
ncbi:MAG: hypothetical protein GY725_01385 [bacterium]|nr:hypothetical protein [bacterium]